MSGARKAFGGNLSQTVVVVGLGYVGLPLAYAAAVKGGYKVIGFDLDLGKTRDINSGRSPVDDVSNEDLLQMRNRDFIATSEPAELIKGDVVVICVPTPLGGKNEPDLTAVQSATQLISKNLKPGATVILESTTYPGTTEEIVRPILEKSGLAAGSGFFLAYSPERIDPGNKSYGVTNTPKIVGGADAKSKQLAVNFYSRFVDSVVPVKGIKEAETAKLLENTYRQINIALVNELAQMCHLMGIDVWEVIDAAATKPFGFQAFRPSIGVGGHCIPIDPNYLSFKVRSEFNLPFEFIELAGKMNDGMPRYVAERIDDSLKSRMFNKAEQRIILLGVAYKPNSSDVRETPSQDLFNALVAMGYSVAYCDPHVEKWNVSNNEVARVNLSDLSSEPGSALVIAQAHKDFLDNRSLIENRKDSLIFDATGRFQGMNVERL